MGDDLLPLCKPQIAAFEAVLAKVGVEPGECVMVEDSMKNLRAAKELGMKTVLVRGRRARAENSEAARAAEATKMGDLPKADDPAVDVSIEVCSEIREALPGLW